MSLEFPIKFSGILMGVLARSLLPWLRKSWDGVVTGFGRRYFVSALAPALIGLILTLVVFPKFEAGGGGQTFEALFKLFCLAFGFGFSWNVLVLEGGTWAGTFAPESGEEKAPSLDK